jgi:hypothetical protein
MDGYETLVYMAADQRLGGVYERIYARRYTRAELVTSWLFQHAEDLNIDGVVSSLSTNPLLA